MQWEKCLGNFKFLYVFEKSYFLKGSLKNFTKLSDQDVFSITVQVMDFVSDIRRHFSQVE